MSFPASGGAGTTSVEEGPNSAQFGPTSADNGQIWPNSAELGRVRPSLAGIDQAWSTSSNSGPALVEIGQLAEHGPNFGRRRLKFGRLRANLVDFVQLLSSSAPSLVELGQVWPNAAVYRPDFPDNTLAETTPALVEFEQIWWKSGQDLSNVVDLGGVWRRGDALVCAQRLGVLASDSLRFGETRPKSDRGSTSAECDRTRPVSSLPPNCAGPAGRVRGGPQAAWQERHVP